MAVPNLKKKKPEPNHHTTKINYLGVCIAVKANASVFLLGEAGVAALAVRRLVCHL